LQSSTRGVEIYQWELVGCGHRDRCKTCQSGRMYGLCLYRYLYKSGKYTKQYIRLKDLESHTDARGRQHYRTR
jgi:hypothetical protein